MGTAPCWANFIEITMKQLHTYRISSKFANEKFKHISQSYNKYFLFLDSCVCTSLQVQIIAVAFAVCGCPSES